MEDLRSGRIARSLQPRIRKPERMMAPVLITGNYEDIEPEVRRWRGKSVRTAFMCADRKRGTQLSQAVGARFYPCDLLTESAIGETVADIRIHWSCDPVVITF